MRVPFVGPSAKARGKGVDEQYTQNFYIEQQQDGRGSPVLYSFPTNKEAFDLNSVGITEPVEAMHVFQEKLYIFTENHIVVATPNDSTPDTWSISELGDYSYLNLKDVEDIHVADNGQQMLVNNGMMITDTGTLFKVPSLNVTSAPDILRDYEWQRNGTDLSEIYYTSNSFVFTPSDGFSLDFNVYVGDENEDITILEDQDDNAQNFRIDATDLGEGSKSLDVYWYEDQDLFELDEGYTGVTSLNVVQDKLAGSPVRVVNGKLTYLVGTNTSVSLRQHDMADPDDVSTATSAYTDISIPISFSNSVPRFPYEETSSPTSGTDPEYITTSVNYEYFVRGWLFDGQNVIIPSIRIETESELYSYIGSDSVLQYRLLVSKINSNEFWSEEPPGGTVVSTYYIRWHFFPIDNISNYSTTTVANEIPYHTSLPTTTGLYGMENAYDTDNWVSPSTWGSYDDLTIGGTTYHGSGYTEHIWQNTASDLITNAISDVAKWLSMEFYNNQENVAFYRDDTIITGTSPNSSFTVEATYSVPAPSFPQYAEMTLGDTGTVLHIQSTDTAPTSVRQYVFGSALDFSSLTYDRDINSPLSESDVSFTTIIDATSGVYWIIHDSGGTNPEISGSIFEYRAESGQIEPSVFSFSTNSDTSHKVRLVYTGQTLSLYIDGELQNQLEDVTGLFSFSGLRLKVSAPSLKYTGIYVGSQYYSGLRFYVGEMENYGSTCPDADFSEWDNFKPIRVVSRWFPEQPGHISYMDGFFLIVDKENTGRFRASALYDGNVWPAFSFATAERKPDALVSIQVSGRELWLVGEQSAEVWYNAGNPIFPFVPSQQGFLESGAGHYARHTVLSGEGSTLFLGRTPQGESKVYSCEGLTAHEASNRNVESQFFDLIEGQSFENNAIASAMLFQYRGHLFYVLNIIKNDDPTDGISLVFDGTNGSWVNISTPGSSRWCSDIHEYFRGYHLFSARAGMSNPDGTCGQITYLSEDISDPGLERIRRSPYIFFENRKLRHYSVEVEAQVEDSLVDEPVIYLRWSDDNGRTWTSWKPRVLQDAEGNRKRTVWRKLGSSRNRVYELKVDDPVNVTIVNAWASLMGFSSQAAPQEE